MTVTDELAQRRFRNAEDGHPVIRCSTPGCPNCMTSETRDGIGGALQRMQRLGWFVAANTGLVKCPSCVSLKHSVP